MPPTCKPLTIHTAVVILEPHPPQTSLNSCLFPRSSVFLEFFPCFTWSLASYPLRPISNPHLPGEHFPGSFYSSHRNLCILRLLYFHSLVVCLLSFSDWPSLRAGSSACSSVPCSSLLYPALAPASPTIDVLHMKR